MDSRAKFEDLSLDGAPPLSDLELGREPDGNLQVWSAPLADKDLSCWLICEWYVTHIEAGGEPDPVVEEILAEVAADQASGIAANQLGRGVAH